jgi:hypothetical protein
MSWRTNKVIRYSIIFFVIVSTGVNGQSWDFGFVCGISSYSQKDLHRYQDYIMSQVPVNAKRTDEFPSYYTFGGLLNKRWTAWEMSIEAGHGSTGGRIYYEDYSGKLILDQLLKSNYVSFSPLFNFYKRNNFTLSATLKTLLLHHTLTVKNSLVLGTQAVDEHHTFKGWNAGLQPCIRARQTLKSFFLQFSAGYEFQQEITPYDKDDLFLAGEHGAVNLQGNGYRITFGGGVRF